jgi:hypothetical protein
MHTMLTAMAAMVVLAGAPPVTGTWSMSIDSPHGNMKASLTLTQDGTAVKGTFRSPMPDMPVSGTFENGTLKVETPDSADTKLIFTAKLKDDDTLSGFLSSDMGDMKWTAARVADKGHP